MQEATIILIMWLYFGRRLRQESHQQLTLTDFLLQDSLVGRRDARRRRSPPCCRDSR